MSTNLAEFSIREVGKDLVYNESNVSELQKSNISGLNVLRNYIDSFRNEVAFQDIVKGFETDSEHASLKITTINEALAGEAHPETGIPYETRIVQDFEGKDVEGVFPNFSEVSRFETDLPKDLYKETDATQNQYCNCELKKAFENGSLDVNSFSSRQLEQISNGDKPEGFTWHHSEIPGEMQLVPTDIHSTTRHTGGRAIWGGGSEAR